MRADELKKPRFRPHRVWIAGIVVAAVSGLAVLMVPSAGQHNPAAGAVQGSATPTSPVSPVANNPAWDRLSATQQHTLEPLKDIWSTLTAAQQDRWRLIVDRFQARPQHAQRRLAARIADWARLSPQQRAHARLNFLALAKRYSPSQRKQHWQAYQRVKPHTTQVATGNAPPMRLPPAFVQASPGATTVLLSQGFERPSADALADRGGSVQASSPDNEARAQGTGAASAADAAAAAPRAEP